MSQDLRHTKPSKPLQEAIDWLVKLRDESLSEADSHAFADWLTQDVSHADAFAKAELLFDNMVMAAHLPLSSSANSRKVASKNLKSPFSLREKVGMRGLKSIIYNPPPSPLPEGEGIFKDSLNTQITQNHLVKTSPQRNYRPWLTLPLALATAWLFAVTLVLPSQSHLLDSYFSDYYTNTGEIRDIQLADGSHILLNTDTAVSVDYQTNKRQITLHHGQVRFTVAKDAQRPFEVQTDRLNVRALGTVFDIYKKAADNISVTVQEHAVAAWVQAESQTEVQVQAGQQLIYNAGEVLKPPSATDLAQSAAWQQRRLFINDRPLSELIAELGRYRVGRIFLADAQLLNLHVTGVFSLDNPDEVLARVRKILSLQETRLGPWWVVLHRN
ncbi:MAG: FecR family protein [Methyloglobulus sp.]|nr:FecR family protein [Methyloglobulus sp.]